MAVRDLFVCLYVEKRACILEISFRLARKKECCCASDFLGGGVAKKKISNSANRHMPFHPSSHNTHKTRLLPLKVRALHRVDCGLQRAGHIFPSQLQLLILMETHTHTHTGLRMMIPSNKHHPQHHTFFLFLLSFLSSFLLLPTSATTTTITTTTLPTLDSLHETAGMCVRVCV